MTKESEESHRADAQEGDDVPQQYTGVEDDVVQNLARQLTRSSSINQPSGRDAAADDDNRSLRKMFSRRSTVNSLSPVVNPFVDEIEGTPLDPNGDNFDSKAWIKNMYKIMQADPEYYQPKNMGFSYKNMSAYGYGGGAAYQSTIVNMPLKVLQFAKSLVSNKANQRIEILKPMSGAIKPGELVVVLGRPGSGCTTYLKTVANQTYGFHVDKASELNYSGLKPEDIATAFRGDVIYSAENETHFPHLTVGQTLAFAALLKTPSNRVPGVTREEYAIHYRDVIMATYGLSHTINTKVGNDFVRGVSGGERKRVSIAEIALCNCPLQCWDNSTRGLDSATALEFIRSLRISSDIFDFTSLVAVYQASDEMYDLFDKVCLLYEGRQIFFGKASDAKQFFMDLGYEPRPRQSTPDFLTSMSSAAERVAKPGFENKVPRTPDEFEACFKESRYYAETMKEVDEFNQEYPIHADHYHAYKNAHHSAQSKSLPRSSPFTVSALMQIKYLAIRGFQRIRGDFSMTFTTIFGNTMISLILSSIFYNLPHNTSSFYHRSAMLFFAILFNAFSSMLEIFALFEARPIVEKHRSYALYHVSFDALGSITTEMPSKIVVAIAFNLILYFMVNLRREAGNFFIYLIVSFLTTLCMSHMFRTIGAACKSLVEAMTPATVFLTAMMIYTGFVIPVNYMHGWARWINYINPIAYGFEALMANEFHGIDFPCSAFVPSGDAYDSLPLSNKVCSGASAVPGQDFINGSKYIGLSYKYYQSHIWRNFGIVIGFTLFFLFTYLLVINLNKGNQTKGEVLIYPLKALRKMERKNKAVKASASDEESRLAQKGSYIATSESLDNSEGYDLQRPTTSNGAVVETSDDIFYWKDVCYDIKIKKADRRILDHVDGWVKPGTLTALMGASGAGKTTLLDTLANRVTMGVVTGDMFVNGTPRDESFQRSTGYAQQQDLHLDTSTVREALTFSALLRQPASVPKAEKLAYVDNVLKILEMEAYADAIVGVPGTGLNVEQRKRLTIGVELAGKPKLLLFLDEPTSGLDSQTAWSVCQLMKKLSNAGQAILCTIHQPSALLMEQFDRLLFLARGGRTVYFGEIGPSCHTLVSYFERNGADACPPDANPAEWMLHVIGAAPGSVPKNDYVEVWKNSPERQAVRDEIARMMKEFGASRDNKATEKVSEFAMPLYYQLYLVTRRVFQQYYRSPLYIYSKIGLAVFSALFNGFSFFKADNTQQGLQNLMFSVFMFATIFNSAVSQYMPYFVSQRSLYEVRERPSKMFSWKAFLGAQIVVELPIQFFCGTVSFLCWYYPVGFYTVASAAGETNYRGGLVYIYSVLFFFFISSMAQMLIAGIELADTATNIAGLMFMFCLLFCGVLSSKEALPGFWIFMYRLSPLTYWIPGVLSVAIGGMKVECSKAELVTVIPPNGQNCASYLGPYVNSTGGYIQNPNDSTNCQYCAMANADTFLASINAKYSERGRNIGIFIAYIAFNYSTAFFLYWLARVPKRKNRVKVEKHT